MKKLLQKDINPFPFTDSNKRYYTYDYYMRTHFGCKVAKITLDAGMTCPNIDGSKAYGGCIYCSSRGSGDFAQSADITLKEQFNIQRANMSSKWQNTKFIPYLQAHTNTYAPIEKLKSMYSEILDLPDIVGFNIATRADCISDECLSYLSKIGKRIELTVELGLQSIFESTARLINRAHTYEDFERCFYRIRNADGNIKICVHLIDGLPGEDIEMMKESARVVGALRPDQVKIHLLHVLKGTVMAKMYEKGEYVPLTLDEYSDVVVSQLEVIPENTVIGRGTGDGSKEDLLAPMWSLKKFTVINEIDKKMFNRNTYQGRLFQL